MKNVTHTSKDEFWEEIKEKQNEKESLQLWKQVILIQH